MGNFFGFLSAICFSGCAIPQAIKCIREKNADGMSTAMLILWLVGELSAIIYSVLVLGAPFWLLFNYTLSTIGLLPIAYYKFFADPKLSTTRAKNQ